jgi:O-antigen ligase
MRRSVYRNVAAAPRREQQNRTSHTSGLATQPMVGARQEPASMGLYLLVALWGTVLFDPHWLAFSKGVPFVVLKLPVFIFLLLGASLGFGLLTHQPWQRRWQWYWPFLSFLIVGAIGVPMAMNVGYARETLQGYVIWYALILGTVTIVDSARRVELLLSLYGLHFLWWGFWGGKAGLVGWHHSFSNYDGFGAFAVGGFAICYFLGMAADKKWFKWLMYATAGLSVVGVVASFARGAFLALVLVFFCIWVRSPHKGRTALAGVGAALLVSLAASLLFEEGFFYNEIMSAFTEGNEEGTGGQRWQLWTIAIRVWQDHPILGAGLHNVGVYASTIFQPGELEGMFANPGALYDYVLHNLYMTVLAENGIVGCVVVAWIFFDYFKRNAQLRSPEAERQWREFGGRMKLRPISLGLEASMVAFMFDALVYSMMGIHWLYTMLAINLLLHRVAVQGKPAALHARPTGRPAGAPRVAAV